MLMTEARRWALALALASPAFLSAPWAVAFEPASSASASAVREAGPRVRIASVRGVDLRGNQARVDLVLEVRNPGGWKLSLDDIRFHCSFNGTATAQGHSTGDLDLPPHGSADVPVRVDVDGVALLQVLAALPSDGLVHYQLDGDAELAHTLLRIPFQEQGDVALRVR
jgi:LEA14-like dessication related protein